jgi:hypothetical protein
VQVFDALLLREIAGKSALGILYEVANMKKINLHGAIEPGGCQE